MKTTIIYDNTTFRNDLLADWGFSALVEAKGKKILFDTGASGSILLSNMATLGIVPKEIDEVFISHSHFDHTGGLSAFLDQNSNVKVWVPRSFRGVKKAREVVEIRDSRKLHEGIYSTGELEGIEQSLCIETPKGIVIIAGCSHPRMEHIIGAASEFGSVYGIIGGLHGNRPQTLEDLDFICATHCTQYKQEIGYLYPERYVEGGAGRVIEIEDTVSVS
ncbi:MAG: MBL fold metallo-hydrolase [Deltaproteobacteria bacterium]|nr:MBL fold metallo-hydrolase [Deltaproteobacteria bacterium]